jgi:hypothetical protein
MLIITAAGTLLYLLGWRAHAHGYKDNEHKEAGH